jgi:ribose 5-phosphate isomerase B
MKIFIGADHGGFELKQTLLLWLRERNLEVVDCGAKELDEDDDYPDYAFAVAQKVVLDQYNRGILLCRSGAGMAIAANKVTGIQAVDAYDTKSARHAVEHNNVNVISLAADWLGEDEVKRIIEVFLAARFTHESRHERRLNKINKFKN